MKLIRALVTIAMSLLLLLTLAIAVPNLLGMKPVALEDDSMRPALPKGSLALAQPAPFSELHEGDVIAARVLDKYLVRRVAEVKESPRQLLTRPDATPEAERLPVPYGDVLGVVNRMLPLVGYALAFVYTTQGKIIAGASAFVIILLFFLLGAGDRKKKRAAQAALTASPTQIAPPAPPPDPVAPTPPPITPPTIAPVVPTPQPPVPEDPIAAVLAAKRAELSKRRKH